MSVIQFTTPPQVHPRLRAILEPDEADTLAELWWRITHPSRWRNNGYGELADMFEAAEAHAHPLDLPELDALLTLTLDHPRDPGVRLARELRRATKTLWGPSQHLPAPPWRQTRDLVWVQNQLSWYHLGERRVVQLGRRPNTTPMVVYNVARMRGLLGQDARGKVGFVMDLPLRQDAEQAPGWHPDTITAGPRWDAYPCERTTDPEPAVLARARRGSPRNAK